MLILNHTEEVKNDFLIYYFMFLLIDLTQAMLSQEPQSLRDAIVRVKNSPHAPALTEEIRQAENLLNRLK